MQEVDEPVDPKSATPVEGLDVVVPVFNGGRSTAVAAPRLARLASGRVDVVFVDDGSTDESGAVLDRSRGPGVQVHHQPNAGPSAARNAGASLGRREWIAFVDVDDVPDDDWADRLLALARGAGIVGCGGRFVRDGQVVERAPTALGDEFAQARVIFLPGCFIVSRAIFDAVGGYDIRFRYSENTELALRVTREAIRQDLTIVSTSDALISIHAPRSGRSNAYSSANRLESAELMLAKHGHALLASPRHLASYEAIAGVESLRLGCRRAARRHLRAAVRLRPSAIRYWRHLIAASMPQGGGPGR